MYFSIIIPVYNTASYLEGCVGGILAQDFTDFEVILIDDGSTDGSGGICGRFAAADPRVRVIHTANGGAGRARNIGLDSAAGEFILFVDSDDSIAEGSLSKIAARNEAEGRADVTFLAASSTLPGRDEINPNGPDFFASSDFRGKTHTEVLARLASRDPLPVCLWDKIIRREVVDSSGLRFTEGIICEDVDFCMRLYTHARTYNYIDVPYYRYRAGRPGSVMSVNTERKYYDLYRIINMQLDLADGKSRKFAPYIREILAFQYCMLLPMYRSLPRKKRAAERSHAAALIWLLDCSRDKRVRLLRTAGKIFGFGGVVFALRCWGWLKKIRGIQ